MRGASLAIQNITPARPFTGRTRRGDIPAFHAAGLLRNFLVAIELEGGAQTPFMKFAKARAERELAMWGEPLTEGGAA